MPVCYSCLLSVGVLLVMTHWIETASLRSPTRASPNRRDPVIINLGEEWTTSEPVLSRRRPLLPSSERRRRWSQDEILVDENVIDVTTAAPTDTSTIIQTTSPEDTTVADSNTTVLIQDVIESNATERLSTIADRDQSATTSSNTMGPADITSTTVRDEMPPTTTAAVQTELATTEAITHEPDTSTSAIAGNETEADTTTVSQTTSQVPQEADTAIILLDYTTVFSETTTAEDNQTSTETPSTTTIAEDSTVVVTTWETTPDLNATVEYAVETTTSVVDDVQNATLTVLVDADTDVNETIAETPAPPLCDLSCQCEKQCPYGFQIANDTCDCDPPCANYECFGNDTCIIKDDGRPYCAALNGTKHDRPERCYQPLDAGYGEPSMRYHNRWYYHPDQDKCHLFVYRGLGGNENNFQTLHECHLECITCAPAADPGECLTRIPMWYYDHRKKQCAQFDYLGCKGNDNKFLRKQDCLDTCLTRILNL